MIFKIVNQVGYEGYYTVYVLDNDGDALRKEEFVLIKDLEDFDDMVKHYFNHKGEYKVISDLF